MKRAMIAAAVVLGSATLVWAQDHPCERRNGCCSDGKDARPWIGIAGGVKWEKSLDDAKRRAAKEGKPILLYQLVGDLDKEGC
jgi:hypothetical protein